MAVRPPFSRVMSSHNAPCVQQPQQRELPPLSLASSASGAPQWMVCSCRACGDVVAGPSVIALCASTMFTHIAWYATLAARSCARLALRSLTSLAASTWRSLACQLPRWDLAGSLERAVNSSGKLRAQ